MDPVRFHQTLREWSQKDDPDELAELVLGPRTSSGEKINIVKTDQAIRLSERIQSFLSENQEQLTPEDLPALKRIQDLVQTFTHWTKETLDQEKRDGLEKIITASIALTKTFDEQVPTDLLNLTYSYLPMIDLMRLSLTNKSVPRQILADSIAYASSLFEFENFVNEVRERFESDPPIFKEMVQTFFQHSSFDSQQLFFNIIRDKNLFDNVINILPNNLPILNLSQNDSIVMHRLLQDDQVESLLKKSNELKLLSLGNRNNLTESVIKKILCSHNMDKLEHLDLCGTIISDEVIKEIANSPYMSNLKHLNLSNTRITNKAIEAIANSSYMSNLKHLNLCNTRITNKAIEAIANSSYMTHLENLLLYDCHYVSLEAQEMIAKMLKENKQRRL